MTVRERSFFPLLIQTLGLVVVLGVAWCNAVAGDNHWTTIGPWGGDRYEVIVDPVDNQKLYVVGGAVHRSLDGGASWESIMETSVESVGLYAYSLVINPQDTNELFIGTASQGVWKSSSGGGLWDPSNSGIPDTDTRIRSLMIDARNPATLLAGIENESGEALAAIYRSDDSGASWVPFDRGLPGPPTKETFVFQNPVSHAFYAGTFGDGIFRYDEDTGEWVPLNAGLSSPLGLFITDIAFDYSDADVMFASTFKDWVYKSVDGGRTWVPIDLPFTLNAAYPPLAYFVTTDPNNSNVVWIGALPGSGWANESPFYRAENEQDLGGLFLSTDGGTSWVEEKGVFGGFGLTIDSAATVSVRGELRSKNLYGTHGGIYSVMKSQDGGVSFQPSAEGLNGNWMNCLHQHPVESAYLFSCNESGMFFSFDGGTNWSLFKPTVDQQLVYSWSAVSDPDDPNRLYYVTGEPAWAWPENKGLFVINTTRLDPSEEVNIGVNGDQLSSTIGMGIWKVYPMGGSVLYLATQDRGVLKSIDDGLTWQGLSTGLVEMSVTSIAFDRSSEPLFAGTREHDGRVDFVPALSAETGALYKWAAETGEWLRVAETEITVPVYDVLVSPDNPDWVFAGTAEGLFVSIDGGATWAERTFGLGGAFPVSDIEIDPTNSQRMFVSSWIYGVFASFDGGLHWHPYNDGLSHKSIEKILIDHAQPEKLYAATLGGSLFEHTARGSAPTITSVTGNGVSLTAPYGISVKEMESVTLMVEATDPDPSDALTFKAFVGDAPIPAPDEVTDPLVELNFDPVTRTLQWTPVYGASSDSPYTVVFVVSDGTLSQAVAVNVQVRAVYPPAVDAVIANGARLTEPYEVGIDEMQPLSIEISGHDPEGVPVEYTAYLGSYQIPSPDEVTDPLVELNFDPATRILQWTPVHGASADSPYTLVFVLSDGTLSEVVEVNVQVDPISPPVVDAVIANGATMAEPYEVRIEETQQLTINLSGHDPDGTPLEYSAYLGSYQIPSPDSVTDPASTFTFDSVTRTFSWKAPYGVAAPNMPFKLTFVLSDGMFVTVAEVNVYVDPAPTVVAPTIGVSLNQTAYRVGDRMTLTATISNQNSPADVDFYLVLGTESNPYMFYIPLVKGVTLPHGVNVDVTLISNFQLNSFPIGTFVWSGILVSPGANVSDSANWIHDASASFTFGAP